MAPTRGFQSSRPFQFQPQPLSINTSGEAKSSMHSASSSTSSSTSSAAESTFSSLPTSPTSPTTALLSPPASSLGSTAATTTTHIHKAPDGSLLVNRDYQSPCSPVGEGFLDPRATTRGSSSVGRGSRAIGGVQGARLHMNMQVSGGAELNMHVRGNVDMIVINPAAQHRGARR